MNAEVSTSAWILPVWPGAIGLVEIGHRAAAGRTDLVDLQRFVTRVLHLEDGGDLIALGDHAVVLDLLDDVDRGPLGRQRLWLLRQAARPAWLEPEPSPRRAGSAERWERSASSSSSRASSRSRLLSDCAGGGRVHPRAAQRQSPCRNRATSTSLPIGGTAMAALAGLLHEAGQRVRASIPLSTRRSRSCLPTSVSRSASASTPLGSRPTSTGWSSATRCRAATSRSQAVLSRGSALHLPGRGVRRALLPRSRCRWWSPAPTARPRPRR